MNTGLNRTVYNLACGICNPAFLMLWKLRMLGRDNLPKTGPVLVIANHASVLDPLLIGLISRRYLTTLARDSLFKVPGVAWFSRCVGTMPLNRETGEGIRTGIEALKAGGPLLMFPEGTRSKDGKLQALEPGTTLLLNRVPCPVVCVGIDGAYGAWPRHRLLPRLSPLWKPVDDATITVSMGPPIDPSRFKGKKRDEMLAILSEGLQAQMDHARSFRRR